jgi:P2 family phage contractile tail tube protein
MEVASILGAMVYVKDGPMLGKFDEITLPEVKNKIQENKATDAIGSRRLPGISIDAMEATFKTSNFNAKFHAMASNPFVEYNLQVRGNLLVAGGQAQAQSRAVGKPIRVELRGWFSSAKEPVFKQGEGGSSDYKFEVRSITTIIDGREIRHVDVDNYQWRVDGVDILADFRKNLGIA